MLEMRGDLWDIYNRKGIIVITTNGAVRRDGACVMGRGIAFQAATALPKLPFRLGDWINKRGNVPAYFEDLRIITMPVKSHWKDSASLALIRTSTRGVISIANAFKLQEIYLPRPGCGNGRLEWSDVKQVIEPMLDDRFTVVEYAGEDMRHRR